MALGGGTTRGKDNTRGNDAIGVGIPPEFHLQMYSGIPERTSNRDVYRPTLHCFHINSSSSSFSSTIFFSFRIFSLQPGGGGGGEKKGRRRRRRFIYISIIAVHKSITLPFIIIIISPFQFMLIQHQLGCLYRGIPSGDSCLIRTHLIRLFCGQY